MADSIRVFIDYLIQGLRASIMGILKIYHMDREQKEEEKRLDENAKKEEEPLTTLGRRRAERTKHRSESRKKKEPRVLHRIALCCAWNGGVFWLSILLFHGVLLPILQSLIHFIFGGSATHNVVWGWIGPMLTWTFSALWILPLFVLSKIVNSLWFQDIADAAYRHTRGRPMLLPSLSKIIADMLFSLLVQSLFLIQSMLVYLLPIPGLGPLVSHIHMCLLYSLYAFEYKWFNMGWEVHKRLSYIEGNWPYFVGFGLPMGVLTAMPSSYIISGCVFSILFPLFIISANEAEPLPTAYDFPLRLFSPVVAISDSIFRLSVKKSKSAPSSDSSVHKGKSASPKHITMSTPKR